MQRPFCRDCLRFSALERRCDACGSPRVLSHPERDELALAHVDCDAFYATIEKRDNPALADRPVIVGGGKRGVVSTCCYIARTYGVRSAMPMFKALDACPEAVVVKPDMEKYARVGRQVRQMMQALTPLVEPLSIDEAFLDLTGTAEVHHAPPALALARFAAAVERDIGITVSVGLSYNKFLAKIASDLDKPRGFSIIGMADAQAFLASKPVSILPGIGPATVARLKAAGIATIADIRRHDAAALMARIGSDGPRLHRLAHGIDARTVNPERETKSVSAETTFDTDIADPEELTATLLRLSEKVAFRLRKQGFAGRNVTLKLKTAQFDTRTRTRGGLPATQLATRLFEAGRDMLAKELDGTRYRLIGIGAGDLCDAGEADKGDLVDTGIAKEVARERAIDALREKFGGAAVQRGTVFGMVPRKPQRET
ncbi:MAG: DNA polymerase IV [Beijerinckiaceae bacterium]